jgi:hypothetical protein
MTNILIPTDLSAASLQLAEKTILALEPRNANFMLFHAFALPAEFDLLEPGGRRKPYADAMNDDFRHACKQLKDQYQKAVHKIFFKYMEGSTTRLFRNFVDANEIDLIICPDDYTFKPIHALSIDPRPLFSKSGVRVVRELVPRKTKQVVTEPAMRTMQPLAVTG